MSEHKSNGETTPSTTGDSSNNKDYLEEHTLFRVLAGDDILPAFCVTDDDGPCYTRSEMRSDVYNVSMMLIKAGVQHGDTVTICLRNQIENVISFLAVTCIGAIAAPINASYAKAEFKYDMMNLSTKYLIVPTVGHELIEDVAEELNIRVLSIETNKNEGSKMTTKARCEFTTVIPETLPTPKADDTALYLHTSGTTGKPKGVPLSHRNMLASMYNISTTYELSKHDKTYLVMPLFHVHGIMGPLFSTLYSKGEVIMPSRCQGFKVDIFWKEYAKYNCTWYSAVPTMHQLLLKAYDTYIAAGKPKLRFIRSSSASLPPSVLAELEKQFNAPVLESYAMTEACHQMASNPLPKHGPHKPGSVGKGTNVEICILPSSSSSGNDDETPLKPGEVGDVCIRGINVTKGYHNRPDANAESFTSSGYFRTGDLGYKDDDDYLFLTGRAKEQINRGGEKIAPVAIDNVLLRCPGVSSLFAFGIPHEDLGETVAVIVVVNDDDGANKNNDAVTLSKLNRFGLDSGELSMMWLPEIIVYSDKVPKGPTGKVQRVKLASMMGMPKVTAADSGAAFTYMGGKLERIPDAGSAAAAATNDDADGDVVVAMEATLSNVETAVGDILGLDVSGLNDQELIIDSFTATRLAMMLNRRFVCGVIPQTLVNGVTISKIHTLVTTTEPTGTPEEYDWIAESQVPESIADGIKKQVVAGPIGDKGTILLTGATGFLGSHMLSCLLRTTKVPVICIARAVDDNQAKVRVEKKLREQEVWNDEYNFDERVICFAGDMNITNFGLNDEHVANLKNVRLIIHNAAAVNHALPYGELKDANVGSLVRAMSLAHTIENANNDDAAAALAVHVAYISTAGVCGRIHSPNSDSPPPISVDKVSTANGYVQGKWVSERLIENANIMSYNAGTIARYSIFRPGAITGHIQTGACNIGDSINRYVIGFTLLGSAPPLSNADTVQVDQSPVNWVGDAIIGLAIQDVDKGGLSNGKTECYTLDNGCSLTYNDLLKALGLTTANTYADWLATLEEALKKEDDNNSNASYPNPLGDLIGALRMSAPKFGSTGSIAHMKMLSDRGYPTPKMTSDIINNVYMKRFIHHEKVLPPTLSA